MEYQKSVRGLEDSDDDLCGRSVTQEINYSNKKQAQKQIKDANLQSKINNKIKLQTKKFNDEMS